MVISYCIISLHKFEVRILNIVVDEDSNPYATDEDKDYNPREDENSESSDFSETNGDAEETKNANDNEEHITPKSTRKRRRRESEWKRNARKRLRTEGKEYVGHKNKVRKCRKLEEYNHMCRYKCNQNIPESDRQKLFDEFYKLPSYDLQSSFLSSCIKKDVVARRSQQTENHKTFSTKITLLNKRVCKPFFLKTFDISNRRFTTVCEKTSSLGICKTDKRGKASSVNKINQETRNAVIQHIRMFPKYKSHYSRKDNMNTRYLSPDLNIAKLLKLYKEYCEENNHVAVKLSYYRHVFNTEFNLRFHRPHTDTCSTCDALQNVIKHSTNEEKVASSKVKLEHHQRRAEKAVSCKLSDIKT